MVQELSEIERLRLENARLREALRAAGLDADVMAERQVDLDGRQGANLAISRAETSVARAEVRRVRRDAAVAEQRHAQWASTTARALATSQDLVEALRTRDRRQAALLEMGECLRDLRETADIVRTGVEIAAEAIDASRAAYGIVDAAAETVEIENDWCAPGVPSIAGVHRFRDFGSFIDDLKRGEIVVIDDTLTDPRTRENSAAFAALNILSLINVPLIERGRLTAVAVVQSEGPRAWTLDELAFIAATSDRIRAALARSEAEARQAMLNGEIAHRLKNTLAIVQAITIQTLRRASSVAEAGKVLSHRLMALGMAHDALTQGRTDATSVSAVVASTLSLHGGFGERIATRGSEVDVGPSAALSLTLMLHELATNAVKYGALSLPDGRVEIVWTAEPSPDGDVFALTWTETGGPAVTAPSHRGFGSQLIERGFGAGAAVSVAYRREGVAATLRAPVAALQGGIATR